VRVGRFQPRLYFHDAGEDPNDLFVPIPFGKEKDHLKLDGSDWMWSRKGGASSSDELRSTCEACPFIFDPDTVDDLGHLYISNAKLNEKTLFKKSRKHIVVSGDHIAERHDADSSGKTILAWNLRLTRVK
jgi:hypothetical protein